MPIAFLVGSIVLNSASYLVYKSIGGLEPRLWWPLFVLGLGLGAANTYLFARSLKSIPLSLAYPVFSAACIAIIALASYLLFQERVKPIHLAGIAVIAAGIFLATR